MTGTALDDAIAERVRKLNPYYSGSLSDPNEKDIDTMIIQAAWKIQHPKTKTKNKNKMSKSKS